MKMDQKLRDLESICLASKSSISCSYKMFYKSGEPITYVMSADAASGRSDIPVLSNFLASLLNDGISDMTVRAALITGYLLGYSTCYAKPNLALLSISNNAARTLRYDKHFHSLFNQVYQGQGSFSQDLTGFQSVVAFVTCADDLSIISEEKTIGRGVVIYPSTALLQSFADALPSEPEQIDLNVDLGDGPARSIIWGHR